MCIQDSIVWYNAWLLKYYQNELELSTVTVSHTLEPRMAGHLPMKVKLPCKKPESGRNLFSQKNVHWVITQQFTVQENCVGSHDRAQLKFILIILQSYLSQNCALVFNLQSLMREPFQNDLDSIQLLALYTPYYIGP